MYVNSNSMHIGIFVELTFSGCQITNDYMFNQMGSEVPNFSKLISTKCSEINIYNYFTISYYSVDYHMH